jgi:hypothetical protein
VTRTEAGGTLALCAAIAAVIVGVVVGSPRPAQPPAPVFTPTVFCPAGQRVVKIRADGMPVCAAPVKHSPFAFSPRPS